MSPNILDLAIVSGNLGPISSCKVGEDCGSYHLPIHVRIDIGINKLPTKLIRPLKNIDWDEFKDSLREKEMNRNWWKFTPEIAKLIKAKRKVRRILKEDNIPGLKPLYNRG